MTLAQHSRRARALGACRALALVALMLAAPGLARAVPAVGRGPTLGFWEPSPTEGLPPRSDTTAERPMWAVALAAWPAVERTPGVFDWSAVDAQVDAIAERGLDLVLVLEGEPADSAAGDAAAALERWLAFARAALRRYAGRLAVVQVGARVEGSAAAADAPRYAFVLKATALAVRAEARAAGQDVWIAQRAPGARALDWQRELWAHDVAAYIDVLPIVLDPRAAGDAGLLGDWIREIITHPPAAEPWVWVDSGAGSGAASVAAGALDALRRGAAAALVGGVGAAERPALHAWVAGAHGLLADCAPAAAEALRLESLAGGAAPAGGILGRFVRGSDLATLVFYRVAGTGGPEPAARLVVDAPAARNAQALDPASGREWRVASAAVPGGRAIEVPGAELPLALLYERGPMQATPEPPREELESRATRELTAEEIIARNQQVQRYQDDRLERWTARGKVDFHFRFASAGPTVDVGIVSNYFWERGAPLEWEQVEYFFNGSRVRWKNMPELPLIEPEKVLTLPLDLTLDRTYTYRLVGREKLEDREAYVLEFQPADPDAPLSLYRGRVWIDTREFVRLRTALVQTALDPPVLSNEERDDYAPQGEGDAAYWLLTRLEGQQTWNTVGRTLVVRRELVLDAFRINPPAEEFAEARARARASEHTMLTETDAGVRYLERGPDGTRVVQTEIDTSQLFAAAGAFRDRSTEGVVPLAGVDYFNYDWLGRDVQVNAFFAGVLGFFTASKADLFGRNLDATADLALSALRFTDELFVDGVKVEAASVRERPQSLSLRLGVPVGPFWKFNLIGGLAYYEYTAHADATAALAAANAGRAEPLVAVLPADHAELRGEVQVEFNRLGYTVLGGASWSSRSSWDAWGLYDPACACFVEPVAGPGGSVLVPVENPEYPTHFVRWNLTANREWFLGGVHKLRGEVSLLGGADLDRFSRYGFSQFGDDRLAGFSGSGVRFDRGAIARASYAFNVLEALRLGAEVESAWVEERDDPAGLRRFTGVGLFANLPGPWKTVFSVSYGRAVDSAFAELEGEQEFRLLVFKLF